MLTSYGRPRSTGDHQRGQGHSKHGILQSYAQLRDGNASLNLGWAKLRHLRERKSFGLRLVSCRNSQNGAVEVIWSGKYVIGGHDPQQSGLSRSSSKLCPHDMAYTGHTTRACTTSFELAIRPDIPDLFPPTRSHRFSVILIHDYWVLQYCTQKVLMDEARGSLYDHVYCSLTNKLGAVDNRSACEWIFPFFLACCARPCRLLGSGE
jgi:hypothetical protein